MLPSFDPNNQLTQVKKEYPGAINQQALPCSYKRSILSIQWTAAVLQVLVSV